MRTNFSDLIRSLWVRWPGDQRGRGPDPFETLAIQYRLTSVATEIHALENDESRWARGFHVIAATSAYDQLLCEAARLSGIPIPDGDGPVRRVILEAELRGRGWSW